MWFTWHHRYETLERAVQHSARCTSLRLLFVDKSLEPYGRDFLQLKNLNRLYIQGDVAIYDSPSFKLPEEIGSLKKIRSLTLLNLPLNLFPYWIFDLSDLRYLTIRGTDITTIPARIIRLSRLVSLRVENCPLTALPAELKALKHLEHIGVVDTPIGFPRKLFTSSWV